MRKNKSEMFKEKMRENAKTNPNYGMKNKHHSEKTKQILREFRLGKKLSEEAKEKLRANAKVNTNYGMKGKHQSEESKQKQRDHIISEERRQKQRESAKNNANYGMRNKKMSEIAKEKIRIAKKGYKQTEAHRLKNKEARLDYYKTHNNAKLGTHCSKTTIKKISEAREKQIFPIQDTSIEIKIQDFLKELRIEFLTHQYMKIYYGYQCDIFIPVQEGISQKTIIECDGDYFHGNPEKYDSRKLTKRIKAQRCLDFERTAQLEEKGFRVIRLWEHEIKKMGITELKQKI